MERLIAADAFLIRCHFAPPMVVAPKHDETGFVDVVYKTYKY